MKCARTACNRTRDIVCRHTQTGRMYCVTCARAINDNNPEHPGLVEIPKRSKQLWRPPLH
jgi:hypothetical protein